MRRTSSRNGLPPILPPDIVEGLAASRSYAGPTLAIELALALALELAVKLALEQPTTLLSNLPSLAVELGCR